MFTHFSKFFLRIKTPNIVTIRLKQKLLDPLGIRGTCLLTYGIQAEFLFLSFEWIVPHLNKRTLNKAQPFSSENFLAINLECLAEENIYATLSQRAFVS